MAAKRTRYCLLSMSSAESFEHLYGCVDYAAMLEFNIALAEYFGQAAGERGCAPEPDAVPQARGPCSGRDAAADRVPDPRRRGRPEAVQARLSRRRRLPGHCWSQLRRTG